MFSLVKIENASKNVPEPEYLDATASEAISQGEALVLSSGKLTKCGATTKPAFIALGTVGATDTKREVAVMRVTADQVFEVETSAAPTSLNVGDKVTLHTDGLAVTATTTNGVATVVDKLGATALGDKIRVRIA